MTTAPLCSKLHGQGTVAAAEIEDAFARTRRQQRKHIMAERGYKARVAGVETGIPVPLRRGVHLALGCADGFAFGG